MGGIGVGARGKGEGRSEREREQEGEGGERERERERDGWTSGPRCCLTFTFHFPTAQSSADNAKAVGLMAEWFANRGWEFATML